MAQRKDAHTGEAVGTTRPVDLPRNVASRVEARLEYSEFDSVDEYVTFVVREVLAHVEDATDAESVDVVDKEEVDARLEALGYLD